MDSTTATTSHVPAPPPFRLKTLPLQPPRVEGRRISQSSSCAPMIPKSLPLSHTRTSFVGFESTANNNNNTQHHETTATTNSYNRRRRHTLSEPSAKLNKLMSSQLKQAELEQRRKSKTFTTQPDEEEEECDEDGTRRGPSPAFSDTLDGSTAMLGADGMTLGRSMDGSGIFASTVKQKTLAAGDMTINAAALAREAEERRKEANELLESCALMISVLVPERDFDRHEVVRTGPSDEELDRLKQLEWEKRNKIRPVDDDYRDFECPKKWSSRRRAEAKLDFFRNHVEAGARLQDRMSFYRGCDRELSQSARDGAEYRQAKMQAFVNGWAPPTRPPSTARPRSARSWTDELQRRKRAAEAPAHQQQQHQQQSAAADQSPGGAASDSTSPQPQEQQQQQQQDQQKKSSDHGQLSDALRAKQQQQRPQSARVGGGGAGGGRGSGTGSKASASSNNYAAAGEGQWVRKNYSEHAIPIVELPPRDAAHWHVRNERWLENSMRHRSEKTRERAFRENERLSAAFYKNRTDVQLSGHYGQTALVPRPLSARSTQTAVQRFRLMQ